jgi:amidase
LIPEAPPGIGTLGAFCAHASVQRSGAPGGPLAGLAFAVKDVFAVQGVAACFGNPSWLRAHPPAPATCAVVTRLLAAGATLVGITITDEMALSLTGENHHYGTPVNPCCPDRVPGGSSSGSASAVAGGAVDFALGTDTGGSVRVPASHTGVLGVRPTWGAVSTEGVLPLAPGFDTVGWFARGPEVLAAVGAVLLEPEAPCTSRARPAALLVPEGVESLLDEAATAPFHAACRALSDRLEAPLTFGRLGEDLPAIQAWAGVYLDLQNAQIARTHREFLERERPTFGALIAPRFARALAGGAAELEAAERVRERIVGALRGVLDAGSWLVLPSAPGAAPPRRSSVASLDAFTWRGLALAAPASLGGLPQISLPLATSEACPLGVSLVGPPGADAALLASARRVMAP